MTLKQLPVSTEHEVKDPLEIKLYWFQKFLNGDTIFEDQEGRNIRSVKQFATGTG